MHFFTTVVWNCTICSEMQLLWCLSARLDLYLCWLTVGRCNAGFIKAVSAGVHSLYAAHRQLCCCCCWLLRSVLFHFSPLSGNALKFSFPTDFFSNSDFLLLEGKSQASWTVELCGTYDTTLCVFTVMDNWYILFLLVLLGALSWSI